MVEGWLRVVSGLWVQIIVQSDNFRRKSDPTSRAICALTVYFPPAAAAPPLFPFGILLAKSFSLRDEQRVASVVQRADILGNLLELNRTCARVPPPTA